MQGEFYILDKGRGTGYRARRSEMEGGKRNTIRTVLFFRFFFFFLLLNSTFPVKISENR